MNIREHIEAGHYGCDEKGRALVPMRGRHGPFTVAATDKPGVRPIVGWDQNGIIDACQPDDPGLLPPAPRKRSGWIVLERTPSGAFVKQAKVFETEAAAKEIPFCSSFHSAIQIEWEEPV